MPVKVETIQSAAHFDRENQSYHSYLLQNSKPLELDNQDAQDLERQSMRDLNVATFGSTARSGGGQDIILEWDVNISAQPETNETITLS